MPAMSLDEQFASRCGRALCAIAPAVDGVLLPKIRRDGQDLEPELIFVVRSLGLRPHRGAAALRKEQNKLARIAGGRPLRSIASRDLVLDGAAGPIGARLYERAPEGARDADAPLLVFFHGGGFVFGDLDTHDASCRLLAHHSGAKVLAVDYRLAPEHHFPAAIDDARAALRFAHAHAAELGVDPRRIGVAGDSAGGNLAAVVSQVASRDGGPAPACQLLIYPGIDRRGTYASLDLFARGFYLTKESILWFQKQYVPEERAEPDPRFNPLASKDLRALPPALVFTAGFDPLRDEGEAYAAAMAAQGNVVTVRRFGSMMHGFWNLVGISPKCREAVAEIAGATRLLLRA